MFEGLIYLQIDAKFEVHMIQKVQCQLAAVVLVLPALFWLRKTVWEAKVVRVVSAVVMGVGIALFIERIV